MSRRPAYRSPLVAVCTLALCLVGCGGGGGGGPNPGTDPSGAARLASLASSVGVMDPAFDSGTTQYAVWGGAGTTSVLLTPTPAAAGATVTVNGGPPGVPLPVLGFGLVVDIVVTSPDGSTELTYSVTVVRVMTRDLIDPTPRADDRFGHSVAVLGNGHIVVTDPYDWTAAVQAGAVHIYHPVLSVEPIASVHGAAAADLMGLGGITLLANDNFVVSSPGGVNNVGTVQLIDGELGTQIGPTLAGGLPDDFDSRDITALTNGNYVVSTPNEDVGGRVNAGAVRLFSGTSGTQIGVTLSGDVAFDRIASDGVKALANSNFVLLSPLDDENGVVNAGSARLISGATGAPVGPGVVGETPDDLCSTRFAALGNGRFVVVAELDDEDGIVDAGAVRLFSSTTGAQIGASLVGDTEGDALGQNGLMALENGNYVIKSGVDDVGGIVNAGSVRLVSGATGVQIGLALAGATAEDRVGSGQAIAVGNGNFVFISGGGLRLVSGTTGAQIGATVTGSTPNDLVGARLLALGNGHFVFVAPSHDVGGIVDAGSVRLFDGTTGLQIGPSLAGDDVGDQLGGGRAVALPNGNYVVVSTEDDVGGVSDVGSVRLVSGTLGVQIGPTLAGDLANDRLGGGGTTVLGNGNFVVSSRQDDEGGVVGAGSVRLVSGVTGLQLVPALSGGSTNDQQRTAVAAPSHGGFFVVGFSTWDNGSVESGRVRVIAD